VLGTDKTNRPTINADPQTLEKTKKTMRKLKKTMRKMVQLKTLALEVVECTLSRSEVLHDANIHLQKQQLSAGLSTEQIARTAFTVPHSVRRFSLFLCWVT